MKFHTHHPLKNRVFHYFHHPFWGVNNPYFWKHPSETGRTQKKKCNPAVPLCLELFVNRQDIGVPHSRTINTILALIGPGREVTTIPAFFQISGTIWVFPKIGGKPPKWMVKIMEKPIKMDDLGVPLFLETPKFQAP